MDRRQFLASVAAGGTLALAGSTVRAGETVTSIAKQYSVKANALLAANPGLDARRMRIGQTLTVPVP